MNRRVDNAPLKAIAPQHTAVPAEGEPTERRRDGLARTLSDYSADCIVILDLDGRMQSVNRPGRHALGLAETDAFLNKPWVELWRGAERDAAGAAITAARAGGMGRFQGFAGAPNGGAPLWWDVMVTPIADAGAPAQLLVVAREIGELHRAEEDRNRLLDAEREARTEAELLNHLGRILNAELNIDKLVQSITDVGTALAGAQFGAFFYNAVTADGKHYVLHAISGVEREAFAKFPMPRATEIFEPTFSGREAVRLDDVTQDRRYGKNAPHHGMPKGHPPVKSYLAVPVVSRSGEVIGGLFFGHAEPGRFTERHSRTLLGVAAHAAVAIDNARLFEDVREREERLRVTAEHAPVGIGECGLDGRFLVVNRKFCDITGYSEQELLGKRFADITHPDDVALNFENFRRLQAGEIPWYRLEKRYIRKDGATIWIDLTVSLAHDTAGKPRYSVGVIEDITERKQAALAIARNNDRLHLLARAADLLLAGEDPDQTLHKLFAEVAASLGTEMYFNYVIDEATGRLKLEHYAGVPADLAADITELDIGEGLCGAAAERRGPLVVTDAQATTDPARARCRAVGFRLYVGYPLLAQGELVGTLSFASREQREFSDDDLEFLGTISHYVAMAKQRARTLKRLQQREHELRLITDAAPALISYVDAEMRYRFNNRAYENWFNVKREDIYGKHVSEVLGEDAYKTLRGHMEQARAGRRVTFESWVSYREGGRRYIGADYIPHADERGRVQGFYVLVNDFTARKQAEEAVQASETELARMADAMPALVAYVAADGRYQFTNEAYHTWFGKSRAQTLGRHVRDVVGDQAYEAIRAEVEQALGGTPVSYERWVPYAGCGLRFVRAALTPRLTAAGKPDGFFVLVTDLTETKRAEERTQLLAEVSSVLASSLDYEQTLQQLSRLAVPRLADWCAIDMRADDGALARVALAHVDADKLAHARALMERYPPGTTPDFGTYAVVQRVLESRQPQWLAEVPDDLLRSIAKDDEHLAALRSFGFRSFVCAPLIVRGRAIGAISFVYADSARSYAAADVHLIQEVAGRAAIAVDNARLYAAAQAEIAERTATEARLRESEARFQAVFANALDAIMLADDSGRYVDVNPAACALLGYTREELITQTLASLAPPPQREAFADIWAELRARGEQTGEYELVRRDGTPVTLAYRAVANILPGLHLTVLIDITERKRAERALEARARQQETVARLGQAALEHEDLPAMLQLACELTALTLDAELCKVLELEPDGTQLRLCAGVGWHDGLMNQATVGADEDSQAGYTLKVDGPVVVEDLGAETRFHGPSLLREHGVVSGMSVPIAGDGDKAYGVFGVHTRKQRAFTQDDVNFLQAVSHVVATAIQRRNVADALRRARDELEDRVLERTAELAKANESLRDEIVERMGVEAALRDSEAQYRLLFERNPLPAWVFDLDTRDILAANETAVWRYGYTRDELLRMSIQELHPPEDLKRPLDYVEKFPPETAYVGLWRHRKQDDTIIDVEMFVYEVLFRGRWARLVLANDITERKRMEQEMRLIESITRAINDAHDLDGALAATLAQLGQATGWVLGEAWVPNERGDALQFSPATFTGAKGFESYVQASKRWRVKQGTGCVGQAWASRQPVWVTDIAADPRFKRGVPAAQVGIRSAVSFPVMAGERLVAVLAFYMREARREDDRQVKLVSTIATQVGLAIQRKQAEEALRESEERFRLLVEGARDYAIFMLDPEGRIASWNAGAERLKGYTASEIVGRNIACFYTDEDVRAGVPQKSLARALADGAHEIEGWRVRRDGARFWATVVTTVLRDAGGGVRGFVKMTRDISERRTAEQRLRESEARLARAQEFSLLMVAHTDLDGRWLKVPQTLCALLGYAEKELLAARVQDVSQIDDYDAERALCQRLVRGEAKSFDLEKRFLRRDGKTIWVYQNTSIVLDAQDRPVHFLTFLRDITSRKEAEDELRKSQLQMLEAQRLAHMGSWEWDIRSGEVHWSDELYRIYGLPPASGMSYERYLGMVHPDDRARVVAEIETSVRDIAPFSFEERIQRASDGSLRHLHSQGAVIANDRGEPERLVGVCLDITERKHAEERLREYATRLAGLSTRLLEAQESERRRIARELHDQIGQDLSVIKINLQSLQRLPGATALGASLDETIRIVESVLSTARNLSLELRPSMLDDLGLPAALRWYLDRQAQRAGFSVQLLADPLEARIAPTIETACFRVTQEAVTNIMRHAQAQRVVVEVRREAEALVLRITDDGKGFDVSAARARAVGGESFGVLGMEERTLLAGGTLEISSTPGRGTDVVAQFPLKGAG